MMGHALGKGDEACRHVENLRHCIFGEGVAKASHDLFDARPVLTDLAALCVAVNHGHAEVALGRVIPLLLLRGHGERLSAIR